MNKKISDLISALEGLKEIIDSAVIGGDGFKQHGWNQVHLHKEDLSILIENFVSQLKGYGGHDITEGLHTTIEGHIKNIQQLSATSQSYFNNNASHLVHMVPSIILTVLAIFKDVEFELFSYENIQDKKLLPRGLASRLRSIRAQLDTISEASASLEGKVLVINEAHEAAESLPTDLASLKDAKKQLEDLLKTATDELLATKKELSEIKEEVAIIKNAAQKACDDAVSFKNIASDSASAASKLVEECDDALQVTTTQGLAAGFDQKAKELRGSIWIWIVGLIIALGAGAWVGAERVAAFTEILDSQLTAGQAILHTIMSLFSIGGPLWLAWISTQQINQRFKLSEDYSYKATVAKSFTGFKKLAERFDQSTEERLFNSTLDRFDEMPLRLLENKDYNSPWHEFVDSEAFNTAIAAVPALAGEALKFASKADIKKHSARKRSAYASKALDNEESPLREVEEKETA